MNSKIVIGVAIFAALLVAACSSGSHNVAANPGQTAAATGGHAATGAQSGSTGQTQAAPQRIRLADTRYMQYASLISDNATSQREQEALAGFQVTRQQQADGSLLVTLKALNPEYQDQAYTVQPGQQLYFIETSMGDDRGTTGEYNLGDDTAVLVDSDGYIVR